MEESVILQMLYGLRGNRESIKPSDKYYEALDKLDEHDDRIQEKIKDNEELVALFKERESLELDVAIVGQEDYYVEGFRFGVLMGLDIAKKSALEEE